MTPSLQRRALKADFVREFIKTHDEIEALDLNVKGKSSSIALKRNLITAKSLVASSKAYCAKAKFKAPALCMEISYYVSSKSDEKKHPAKALTMIIDF